MMQESQGSQIKWLAAALLVVALAAFLIWNVLSDEEGPDESTAIEAPAVTTVEPTPVTDSATPAPDAETTAADAPADAAAAPKPTLPSLDESDKVVKQDVADASSMAAPLLTEEFIIRKAVRAVAALAGGELVNQYRPLKDPSTPFAADQNGDNFTISESNYRRYSPYVDALAEMGPERLAEMYWHYYPLLEEAYRELGIDKRDFKEVTLVAVRQMLAVPPEASENIKLKHPTVMYKYADPELEALPAASKLMLRIGPENREKLIPVLEDLQQALSER